MSEEKVFPFGAWELEPGERERVQALLIALGADHQRLECIVHPGNPLPQARSRSRAGQGHYTPAPTRQAQTRLRNHLADLSGTRPWLTGNLALVCIFYRDTARLVDGDNLLKLVQDAGTKANVWRDDSQITGGAQLIELDRRNPRTVIALAPHASTLRRDLQRVK